MPDDTIAQIDNRYYFTSLFVDNFIRPGKTLLDIWKPVQLRSRAELPLKEGTYEIYTVTDSDIGRIDAIAHRFYQDVYLWWAIAWYNNIEDPFTDLAVGMVLLIPKKEVLLEAIRKAT